MNTTGNTEHIVRHHSDAPAEGETEGWVSHDTGIHSQEPAEGPDIDDAPEAAADADTGPEES
ncbi:hypothetical protein [Arthrobacter sp. CJ23]|uniref:hypothetical protein n=1 Tax=Arthrobacter sp. CJ23 TaxID=2972479 RepID=UPI00215CD1E6|nr:hypothetical protein [Arthrobacter sp. CJ23]UVJ39916.1 hypothetical protein NVV90_01585 [Arthrobacter sp. CJ23]